MNTKELIKNLKKSKVLVEFVKVDGSNRKMLCTQNTSMIGNKTPGGKKDATKGVITVFDLEKNDWRSMRESSIRNWTVEE